MPALGPAQPDPWEAMLTTQGPRLYHLGGAPVPRSSLARLNASQPHTLFEALFHKLAAAVQTAPPGHRFRFKAKLLSFDASLIELSLSLFPWAHFANRKAAVKLHVGPTTAATCRCSPRSTRRMPRTPNSGAGSFCRRAASRCSTRAA